MQITFIKKTILLSTVLLLNVLVAVWATGGDALGATLAVTKTDDTNDGVCDIDCSLREAIDAAVAGDTIDIPAGTYTLTLGSQLTIDVGLTLSGAGSGDTIIQADTAPMTATFRVLYTEAGDVTISGVTVQNGNTNQDGGGIYNKGALTLIDTIVKDNHSSAEFSGGGGIYNYFNVSLTLINSVITGNSAPNGGGIYATEGITLTMVDSTVSNNGAAGPSIFEGRGGGIYLNDSGFTLTNTTIDNNTATNEGGGIYIYGGFSFPGGSLLNSTISENTAVGDAGGIFAFGDYGGTLSILNSTIANNVAGDVGGGIFNSNSGFLMVELVNTIVADNTAGIGDDCNGMVTSLGHNLIGYAGGCDYTSAAGDLVGGSGNPIDPRLGPLQDNGGITKTHALLSGPAIDGGDDTASPATDQRGVLRPQGAASDIGAFELDEFDPAAPLVEDDAYGVDEGQILEVVAPGVLENDTDPGEEALTAILIGSVSNGALVLDADGSFTYEHNGGQSTGDSFTYVANNGTLDSYGVATVDIVVNPVNDVPEAEPDTYKVGRGDVRYVAASGVLTNDNDPDSGLLSAVLVNDVFNGTLVLSGDGSFTYEHDGGATFSDSFVYVANDGISDSNEAEVTINVTDIATEVTKPEDANDGICDEDCSLREAILGVTPGGNVHVPGGTYTLDLGLQLIIGQDLTLVGDGAEHTIIQAAVEPGIANARVLEITGGTVNISGVTIRHGDTGSQGGGIYNSGTLTLTDTYVTKNSAYLSGGGIYNEGRLNVSRSTVSYNGAGASTNIFGPDGGGIYNTGMLVVAYSTVHNNTANDAGGGIFNIDIPPTYAGHLRVFNSTISDNTALGNLGDGGGGVRNWGTAVLISSTITGNYADDGGGGIENSGALQLLSSIVAGNSAEDGPDCVGEPTSLGYNLIGDDSGCELVPVIGDMLNVDPLLGPLLNNGGPTSTHALPPGSPAVDGIGFAACNDTNGNPLLIDQRGKPRPQGPDCDIGAFELVQP